MVKGPPLMLIALFFTWNKTTLNMKRQTNRRGSVFASALAVLAGVSPYMLKTGLSPAMRSTTRIGSPSKSMATYLIGPALLSLSLVLRPVTDARPARAIQKSTEPPIPPSQSSGAALGADRTITPPPLQWHGITRVFTLVSLSRMTSTSMLLAMPGTVTVSRWA